MFSWLIRFESVDSHPVRRAVIVAALAVAVAVAAGCGSEGTTQALPQTVVGTLPKPQAGPAKIPKGDAAAGKQLFQSQGCGGCHTYAPANTTGTIGPNLGNLVADAKKANQGSLEQYTFDSIKNPGAYTVPGYPSGVMPDFSSLSDQKIADLVAFLTQPS
jgi:mono/diheme cytochrome c family protein